MRHRIWLLCVSFSLSAYHIDTGLDRQASMQWPYGMQQFFIGLQEHTGENWSQFVLRIGASLLINHVLQQALQAGLSKGITTVYQQKTSDALRNQMISRKERNELVRSIEEEYLSVKKLGNISSVVGVYGAGYYLTSWYQNWKIRKAVPLILNAIQCSMCLQEIADTLPAASTRECAKLRKKGLPCSQEVAALIKGMEHHQCQHHQAQTVAAQAEQAPVNTESAPIISDIHLPKSESYHEENDYIFIGE